MLYCGLVVMLAACSTANRHRFEPISRAGRQVESVITRNGGLAQYRPALTTFASAIDTVRAQPLSSRDQAVIDRYEAIKLRLDDIRLVWEEKEARQQELLPLAEPLPARLQKTYALPVNTNEPPSIYASEAKQIIWAEAKKELDAISPD